MAHSAGYGLGEIMSNLRTVILTRSTPINVGDVVRTVHGEDLIITGISRRKRSGVTLDYVRPYITANGDLGLTRESMFRSYGYDVTFNRGV